MRIILQPLQSLIMQLNRKLIKALKRRCTFLVMQLLSSGSEVLEFCWPLHKIPRRKKKWENVVFHRPITPLNMLIKVLQFLTFGLYLSVVYGIIHREKRRAAFKNHHFEQQNSRDLDTKFGNVIGMWDSSFSFYFVLFIYVYAANNSSVTELVSFLLSCTSFFNVLRLIWILVMQ